MRRVIRTYLSSFRFCFVKLSPAQQKQPASARLSLAIRVNGRISAVERVSAAPEHKEFVECLLTKIRSAAFPSAKAITRVRYKLTFTPPKPPKKK